MIMGIDISFGSAIAEQFFNTYQAAIKQRTVINEPICLGTYEIPKSYVLSNIGLYYDDNEFHIPEKLVIELCIV